jgi:hypothetical protein
MCIERISQIRYHIRQSPRTELEAKRPPGLLPGEFQDADWAGCEGTRTQTPGQTATTSEPADAQTQAGERCGQYAGQGTAR